MKKRITFLAVAWIGLCLFWALPAEAVDTYWQGGTADWSDPFSWDPVPPGPGDTAYIDNGGTAWIMFPGAECDGLYLGYVGTGNAFLDLAGSLEAYFEGIGYSGTGTFDQFGGTNGVFADLRLGYNSTGNGTYNLYGGGLFASRARIGSSGTGTFNQFGGDNNADDLVLGQNVGGYGEYNLSGGGTLTSSNQSVVGASGTGTFNQSGGTYDSPQPVLGSNAGGSGTYNLTGGVLNGGAIVGYAGTGVFNNSGGAHNVPTVDGPNLMIGYESTSNGTYNLMSGGNLMNTVGAIIGFYGTGTFNQSGGTHITSNLRVGQRTGTGTYNLSDGTLDVTVQTVVGGKLGAATGTFNQTGGTLTTTGETVVGYYGTGIFNQSAGIHNTGSMVIGREIGSTGTYNYSGGTLTAGSIVNKGAFNQSGATTVTANVTNNGAYHISGAGINTVLGSFTNNGTLKTTGTTAVFTGTFTNNGTYTSDPAAQYFTDLIIGPTGYLVGGSGDEFNVSGNLLNYSDNLSWNTTLADLIFTGTGTHIVNLASFAAGNTWGTLDFTGGILNLTGGSELRVANLLGNMNNIHNIGENPITIYYGGGEITIPSIPEPSTLLLLGSGLLAGALRRKFQNSPAPPGAASVYMDRAYGKAFF
jgi:hypothetical protein